MKKEHLNLWERIAAFRLDDEQADRPFSKKLAEENKWTVDFTKRAIAEYKKFIFLCVTEPNGASPSPIVDAVWHLHLTYTESYWARFCPEVLGISLHHHPSKGGNDEKLKHDNWYRQTLMAYIQTFEHLPPDDIWTKPYVFESEYFLPKDSPFLIPTTEGVSDDDENLESNAPSEILAQGAYVLIVFLLCAIAYPTLLKGITFLIPFALLGIAIADMIVRYNKANIEDIETQTDGFLQKCSPYIGAWVSGGNARLTTTMLYEITTDCTLKADNKTMIFNLKNDETLYKNPLYAILQTLEKPEISINFINDIVQPYWILINNQMGQKLFKNKPFPRNIKVFIAVFFAIGIIRIFEGLYFNRPILFLLLSIIAFGVILTVVDSSTKMKFSNWKNYFTKQTKAQFSDTTNESAFWQFALGTSVMANWYAMEDILVPDKKDKYSGGDSTFVSACSGSGGDGGSSCGGSGCGGCGGCGGS